MMIIHELQDINKVRNWSESAFVLDYLNLVITSSLHATTSSLAPSFSLTHSHACFHCCMQALELVVEENEDELWEMLITESMKKPGA